MSANVYQDVHDALKAFEDFLKDQATFDAIKTVITALKPHVPAIGQLLAQLISLVTELETEVRKVNVGQVTALTGKITGLLTSAGAILPAQAGQITTLQGVVAEVTQFIPLVQEIIDSITLIKQKLTALNA
jgi:hypothetical protein